MELRLRPLAPADEHEAIAAHAELAPEGFSFLLGWESATAWTDYLAWLERIRRGERMPEDWVPATFLVAEDEGELVGRVSIRHEISGSLNYVGGHIGYGVRPQHRRRGYATEILRQSLIITRALGIEPVLVTCDDDNAGSIKVIERGGGMLEDTIIPDGGSPKRRYWIT